MELDICIVADKEVDKVADMVAGHGCCLIPPKLLRPEPYPALRVYYVSKGRVKKNCEIINKLPYLGLFCHFIKGKNGSKFSQIEVVRLGGG